MMRWPILNFALLTKFRVGMSGVVVQAGGARKPVFSVSADFNHSTSPPSASYLPSSLFSTSG
jgi:hypothetical protein